MGNWDAIWRSVGERSPRRRSSPVASAPCAQAGTDGSDPGHDTVGDVDNRPKAWSAGGGDRLWGRHDRDLLEGLIDELPAL